MHKKKLEKKTRFRLFSAPNFIVPQNFSNLKKKSKKIKAFIAVSTRFTMLLSSDNAECCSGARRPWPRALLTAPQIQYPWPRQITRGPRSAPLGRAWCPATGPPSP